MYMYGVVCWQVFCVGRHWETHDYRPVVTVLLAVRPFLPSQLHCLKLLYAWRDRVAREEDESVG